MTSYDIEKHLKISGLRRTKDRQQLLVLFAEKRTWTVAELHRRLGTADLSTVYRNVQKLLAAGVLNMAHLHDNQAHYEMAQRPHHAHLICNRCRAAQCVPCPVKGLDAEHLLEMRGLCPACRA